MNWDGLGYLLQKLDSNTWRLYLACRLAVLWACTAKSLSVYAVVLYFSNPDHYLAYRYNVVERRLDRLGDGLGTSLLSLLFLHLFISLCLIRRPRKTQMELATSCSYGPIGHVHPNPWDCDVESIFLCARDIVCLSGLKRVNLQSERYIYALVLRGLHTIIIVFLLHKLCNL